MQRTVMSMSNIDSEDEGPAGTIRAKLRMQDIKSKTGVAPSGVKGKRKRKHAKQAAGGEGGGEEGAEGAEAAAEAPPKKKTKMVKTVKEIKFTTKLQCDDAIEILCPTAGPLSPSFHAPPSE